MKIIDHSTRLGPWPCKRICNMSFLLYRLSLWKVAIFPRKNKMILWKRLDNKFITYIYQWMCYLLIPSKTRHINTNLLFIAFCTIHFNFIDSFSFFSALKIHVSPKTKAVLDTFGCFELELRGEVEMKVSKNYFLFLRLHCVRRFSCMPW